MSDLLDKLQSASEGSRELDAMIANELGILGGMAYDHWAAIEAHAPHYTTNLQDAVSLVPEGWLVDQVGEWESPVLRARGPWLAILKRPPDYKQVVRCDHAPTPALAFCAAIIKAHEARAEAA